MKRLMSFLLLYAVCGALAGGGNVCASGQPEAENMQEEGIREFCAADLSDLLLKTREAVYESAEITKEQIVPYDKPAEGSFIENLAVDVMVSGQPCKIQFYYKPDETLTQINCIFSADEGFSDDKEELWRVAAETVELLEEKWKDEMGVSGNAFRAEKVPDFAKPVNKRKSFYMNNGICYNFSFDSFPVEGKADVCDIVFSFQVVQSDLSDTVK